jgi:hypothetical protein
MKKPLFVRFNDNNAKWSAHQIQATLSVVMLFTLAEEYV